MATTARFGAVVPVVNLERCGLKQLALVSGLMLDLEVLLRLSQNIERAGHTDQAISKDMSAEAAALLNPLGPERLPVTWADKRKATLDEAAEFAGQDDTPAFKRHAIEARD